MQRGDLERWGRDFAGCAHQSKVSESRLGQLPVEDKQAVFTAEHTWEQRRREFDLAQRGIGTPPPVRAPKAPEPIQPEPIPPPEQNP